jgi:hypothetical protein
MKTHTHVTFVVHKAFKALIDKAMFEGDEELFFTVQHAMCHDGHNTATKADFDRCLTLVQLWDAR